jgi:hypothetical protein
MFDAFSKMEWKGIKEMAGKEWDKYTANPCMVSPAGASILLVNAKDVSSFEMKIRYVH